MTEQNVSTAKREEALSHNTLRGSVEIATRIQHHLQNSGIDILAAKSVRYLVFLTVK